MPRNGLPTHPRTSPFNASFYPAYPIDDIPTSNAGVFPNPPDYGTYKSHLAHIVSGIQLP
nr:hypothetical protein Q903MT_gene383 [Picea sitchensis]